MARPLSKVKNPTEALRVLSSGLRAIVRTPNIDLYIPHEKQILFHSATQKGKQLIGGNRAGKTHGGAAEAVYYSRGDHPFKELPWQPPLYGRIVTTDLTQGMEKIIIPKLKALIPPSLFLNGSWESSWDSKLRTLYFANGSFAEILSYEMELDKFAGTDRHWIWFDEEPPKDIFNECMMRLIDYGGHWWMTMTPVDGMTWTYDDIYCKSGLDPNIISIVADIDDNPHLDQQAKDDILGTLTETERKARKQGRYVSFGGMIYEDYFQESVSIIEPVIPPKDWLHVASLDAGWNNPTCWLWGAVDKDGRLVIYDEHYESGMVVSEHAAVVHRKNLEHRKVPDYYVGDPSIRNKDPIAKRNSVHLEYLEHGIPIVLGNNDVIAGIVRVQGYMKGHRGIPRIYITRNCVNLLWELKRYRWAMFRDRKSNYEKNKREEPQKKDDHACDSLRYLVTSRPELDDGSQVPPPPDYGAMDSIDPEKGIIDPALVSISRTKEIYDNHLGKEY